MERGNDFTTIRFTYGMVVRGDVGDIRQLKEIIAASIEKLRIEAVYQKVSPARLEIVEKLGVDQNG